MLENRLKLFALLGVFGGLSLTACGEKDGDGTAPAGGGGGDQSVAVQAAGGGADETPALAGGMEAVAKATGFARHLPKSTHAYLGVFDGKGFVEDLRKSKLAKLIEAQAAEAGAFRLDDLESNAEAQMVLSLFAEEIFVGVGDGSPAQAANLITLNELSTREMVKAFVLMGDASLSGEEPDEGGVGGGEAMLMQLFGGFLKDPNGGLPILEKAEMPPVTIGFKVSDADTRGQLIEMAAGGLAQFLQQAGPDGEDVAEEVRVKRGDSEFTGIRIVGKKVAAKMDDDVREQMSQMLDAATVDKIVKIIETKNIVVAVGAHGDYLVGFAGSDIEQFQIAASPAESVLARPDLSFMDSYAGKKLLMVMSMSQELQTEVTEHTTLLGSAALGLKSGLASAKSFGDTQDLEALLGLVAEQERALFDMYTYTPAGLVVYREDGLKVEGYGGSNMPDVDLDQPRKYASVGMAEDIFLFANWVENPAYTEKALEYLDSIGQTVYLGAKSATKLDIPDADMAEFKEGFGMFDEKIRPHLVEIWTALRGDLVAGLGAEGAVIVDLKGAMPTVVGLPQVVIDEGKAPRVGLLSPATEKERLAASWERIDKSAQELLKVASEMTGKNIPMQRPMSSEKNELKTWFFPFPFQNDDFVLSVSVDEENFFVSTSKSFVQDLSVRLAAAEVDESQKGVYLNVNMTLLNGYAQNWLKLLDENAAAIFGEGSPAAEDFREKLPMIKQVVEAVNELKGVKMHIRKEDGTIRSSLHIATAASS